MELILVRFQIPELCEGLVARIQPAGVRFGRRVHDLVRAHVAVLREGFVAGRAGVGPFAGVAAFVGFEVAGGVG